MPSGPTEARRAFCFLRATPMRFRLLVLPGRAWSFSVQSVLPDGPGPGSSILARG